MCTWRAPCQEKDRPPAPRGLSTPLRPHRDSYSRFVPEGVLANTLGVLLVAFGLVVGYVLTRDDWKRPPLAEELALSMDFKTLTEGESPSGGSQ